MAVHRITYRLRYYPTTDQERMLRACFEAKREAWNLSLRFMWAEYKQNGRFVSAYDCQRQMTRERKSRPVFLAAPVEPVNQALNDLGTAWRNWRQGRARVPREKRHVRAARFKQKNGSLNLYRVGDVTPYVVWSRALTGKPKMVTVSEDATGRWHISFSVEEDRAELAPTNSAIGIDLGVREVVCSDGQRVPMPRYFRHYLRRKRILARVVSRRVKGSNRRKAAQLRLAKLDAKIADSRRDWTHKLTTDLIRRHDTITVEDLSTRGMIRNRNLAVSVSDAAMREILRQIEYKAAWAGRTVTVADRFFPSSRLCSDCGWKNVALTMSDRTWTCLGCGIEHDRDFNAAVNLLNYRREAGTISARSPMKPRPRSRTSGTGVGRAVRREVHEVSH